MAKVLFFVDVLLPDMIKTDNDELFCEDIVSKIVIGEIVNPDLYINGVKMVINRDLDDTIKSREIIYNYDFVETSCCGRKQSRSTYWNVTVAILKVNTNIRTYYPSDYLSYYDGLNQYEIDTFVNNARLEFVGTCGMIKLKTAISGYKIVGEQN